MKESRKYILYVGNDYPHKNLKRLKLAFEKLNLDYKLVLVTEFIGDEKLDELYKNASLYVQPSLIEGFGLSPLEAMKRGVPVISSNAACLPEILGTAAMYFDPLDINDIVEKMRSILSNDEAKKELIRKGFEQVQKYSWQKMTKQTLEIYKKIP